MCLGLAADYREPKEEKTTSLLKPYTNFDKIKNMSVNEMAEFLFKVAKAENFPFKCYTNYNKEKNCTDCYKQWLESKEV